MSVPSFSTFGHLSSSQEKNRLEQHKIVNFFIDLKFVFLLRATQMFKYSEILMNITHSSIFHQKN